MPSNPRICDFLSVHIYDHPTWLGIISCWTAGLLDELLNRNIKYFYLENNHHCRQGEKTKHANHQSYVVLVVEMEMFKYWSIRMSTINEINHITFFCCNTFSFLFCSSISLTVIVWTSSSSCWGELLTINVIITQYYHTSSSITSFVPFSSDIANVILSLS